jgi:hypothetical protein
MGAYKEAEMERLENQEARWQYVAEKNGHRCGLCGSTPLFCERVVYFDTGYCASCANTMAKPD